MPRQHWNCWTANYTAAHDGYITHAFEQDERGKFPDRTLCGVVYQESGLQKIPEETTPSCIKCRRSLEKKGITL